MTHTLEVNRGEMGRALQGEKGKALLGGTDWEADPAYEKGPGEDGGVGREQGFQLCVCRRQPGATVGSREED